MSELSYTVLNKAEEAITVGVGKNTYKLSPIAFSICEDAIRGGREVEETFNSMATKITAKSGKVFDAAKAAKEAAKAAMANAITEFNDALETFAFSEAAMNLALVVQDAKYAVEDAKTAPLPTLDLNLLKQVDGRLADSDTEVWSYLKSQRQGQFWYYEVKTSQEPPIAKAKGDLREAKATFGEIAHSEVMAIVPGLLEAEVTRTSFDIVDGKIVYNAENSAGNPGRGSGGGKRSKVEYTDEGNNVHVFESKTELGIHLGSTTKWPHASKEVKAALTSGKAKLLD